MSDRDGHQHPLFARVYERTAARNEARGQAEHRRELLAGLRGRVLEVGIGTGLNLAHYPTTVTEVVAVEPEAYLRARAGEAAEHAPVPVRVLDGVADQVPADDDSFDAVVVSGVLCSVADPVVTLAELRRVLRPDGELRFYEHVLSPSPGRARFQRLANPLWKRFNGGCEVTRETPTVIANAGFELTACRSLVFPPGARVSVVAPRVLGRARAA